MLHPLWTFAEPLLGNGSPAAYAHRPDEANIAAAIAAYRSIASLSEYVLISQDEACVEIHRRRGDIGWERIEYSGVETVELVSIDLSISMRDIYEGAGIESLMRRPGDDLAPNAYAFSSFFNSFQKRQSVPWAMIFCGFDLIIPTSCRRKEWKRSVSSGLASRHLL